MINRKKDINAVLAAFVSFVVLMVACFFAIKSNEDLDTLNAVWSMVFLGSGVLLFIQVFYNAEMAGNLITSELASGRMKVWISLPVSRKQIFAGMIIRLLKRTFALFFILYMLLMLVANGLYHTSPQNIFVAVFGVIQLMLVSAVFTIVMVVVVRSSTSLAITIAGPMLIHIVQVFTYMDRVDSGGESYSIFLETALMFLMPINVAYNNIVYGMTPYYENANLYNTSSSWQNNTILIVWLMVILAIVLRQVKRFETA